VTQPSDQFYFNGGTLCALVHAPAKVGKTTLSTTAPPPICVLDAEGGWRFVREAGYKSGIRLRRIEWNPLQSAPPRWDGTWDFCHVVVRDWNTLTQAYNYLCRTDLHDFRSVIADSVTEAQRKLKANLRGTEQMRIQDWGDLLTYMDLLVRNLRDLVLLPKPNPIQCVMFITETEMKDGMWRPAMQGQFGRALPYLVDICGYLYTEKQMDDTGQPTIKVKKLLIGEGVLPTVVAGERVQGALPDIVESPTISGMMQRIYGGELPPMSELEVHNT
jgi:hypothetical protein